MMLHGDTTAIPEQTVLDSRIGEIHEQIVPQLQAYVGRLIALGHRCGLQVPEPNNTAPAPPLFSGSYIDKTDTCLDELRMICETISGTLTEIERLA